MNARGVVVARGWFGPVPVWITSDRFVVARSWVLEAPLAVLMCLCCWSPSSWPLWGVRPVWACFEVEL